MDGGQISARGARDENGAVGVAEDDLRDAIDGLALRHPEFSASRRVTRSQWIAFSLALAAVTIGWCCAPDAIAAAAMVLFAGGFSAQVLVRLAGALSTARALARTAPALDGWTDPLPIYTLLCPMHREADAAPGLLAAIAALDYPKARLDVKFVLEEDDLETAAALRQAGLPPWADIVGVPPIGPRTKPKALNVALKTARGAFVCVYDAEDEPDPRQLRAALDAFARGGDQLGCVQAPLRIANADASWIARQFAAEYAIQFGQTLPLYAALGLPFPIGGTSNHFRMEALRAAGAWDAYNVTEDADIGFRLARLGWRMTTIDAPTWEEAPTRLGAWLRQRSRWTKGHLQTWLVLVRDPARLLRELGPAAFLALHLQLGGGIAAAFAHGPFAAFLIFGLACGTLDWSEGALAISGYWSGTYAAIVAAFAQRDRDCVWAAATMPLYWPLATIAACRALIELVAAPFYWAKTDHSARSGRRLVPEP